MLIIPYAPMTAPPFSDSLIDHSSPGAATNPFLSLAKTRIGLVVPSHAPLALASTAFNFKECAVVATARTLASSAVQLCHSSALPS